MPVYLTTLRGAIVVPGAVVLGGQLGWTSTYPSLIDLVESFAAHFSGADASLLASVVAPSWSDLEQFNLIGQLPEYEEVPEQQDDSRLRFVVRSICRALNALGPTVAVRCAPRSASDRASELAVVELLRLRAVRGDAASVTLVLTPRAIPSLSAQGATPLPAKNPGTLDLPLQAHRYLAVAPDGLPPEVLRTLGCAIPDHETQTPPSSLGKNIRLPECARRRVLRGITNAVRRDLLCEIYDAWSPDGWGYLRRGWYAVAARDGSRLLAQHSAYLRGFDVVGRDWLYRHLVALAAAASADNRVHASVCAARLANRTHAIGGYRAAISLYRRALRTPMQSTIRAFVLTEFANAHAVSRTTQSLANAEQLCERAREESSALPPPLRYRIEIRTLNILALIAYHRKQDTRALEIEEEALRLLEEGENAGISLNDWAAPFLHSNVAKLYDRRIGDPTKAIASLQLAIAAGQRDVHDVLDLARLLIRQSKFTHAISTIQDRFRAAGDIIDPSLEVHASLLLAIAHACLGDRSSARAAHVRAATRAYSLNLPSLEEVVARVGELCHDNATGASTDLLERGSRPL